MRKKLFAWHLSIGKYAGILIFVWAMSGAVMTVQPLVLRKLDPGFPRLKAETLALANFTLPPSRVVPKSAASFALRQFRGRAWYEVAGADGSVTALDARTGAALNPLLTSDEVSLNLSERLSGGRWAPRGASFLDAYDDQYRKGRLPVYKVAMSGPGAVVLYVSARDGNVESVTTRWTRVIRWAGLGVHTWNFAAVMKGHDDERGLVLSALVALPLAALALVAVALLVVRRRASVASAAVLALVLASPGSAAVIAAAGISGASAGRALPPAASPSLNVSAPMLSLTLPAPAPGLLAVSAPLLVSAAPAPLALSVPLAMPVVPARARPVLPRTARGMDPTAPASHEADASRQGVLFDGTLARADTRYAVAGSESVSPVLSAASAEPRGSASVAPASPPTPSQPNRKALWGLYLTHAGHIVSLSLVWRIAWPLFVLGQIGKAGLGFVGSFDQVADIALGVVAGIVVDRLFPARSMAAASLVRAGVGAAVAAAALWWSPAAPFLLGLSMVHVFALTVIYLGQAAASPAAAGGDAERLQKLNITLKLITTAISIPASYLGGWLISHAGLPAAFLGYALFNALVLAPMYAKLMPKTAEARAESAPARPRASLREVLRFISTDTVMIALFAATAAAMTFAEPLRNTILPIVAKELLHGGALLLGHLMTALYVGQTLGVLALWRWSKKLAPRWWIGMAALGLGSFWLLALAPAHPLFLYIAVAAMGLFTQPAATMIKTLFQREVAARRPELLGRALGVHLMFYALIVGGETALIGWAFSALTGGFLSAILPMAAAYTALAAVILVLVWTVLKKGAPK